MDLDSLAAAPRFRCCCCCLTAGALVSSYRVRSHCLRCMRPRNRCRHRRRRRRRRRRRPSRRPPSFRRFQSVPRTPSSLTTTTTTTTTTTSRRRKTTMRRRRRSPGRLWVVVGGQWRRGWGASAILRPTVAGRWRRGRTELAVVPVELQARQIFFDHPLVAAAFAVGSTLPASAAPASALGPESEAGVRLAAPCDMVGGASSVAAGYDTVTHLNQPATLSASRDMVAPPCHGPHGPPVPHAPTFRGRCLPGPAKREQAPLFQRKRSRSGARAC